MFHVLFRRPGKSFFLNTKTYLTLFYHLRTSWRFLISWEYFINMILGWLQASVSFRKWRITSVWGLRESRCKTRLNTMDFHMFYICNWCWQYFLRSTPPPKPQIIVFGYRLLFCSLITVCSKRCDISELDLLVFNYLTMRDDILYISLSLGDFRKKNLYITIHTHIYVVQEQCFIVISIFSLLWI